MCVSTDAQCVCVRERDRLSEIEREREREKEREKESEREGGKEGEKHLYHTHLKY